ncbi:MAG: dihydroorotate dehydrogenase electron transfer subunit [Desulfitobacteriaceae bacterium]
MLSWEEVVVHEEVGDPAEKIRRLVLRGEVAREARPGQFVHIQVSSQWEPLLRRPLSIAVIDREKEETTVLYRIQGRGTEILAGIRPGAKLSVLGPLGNGFSLPERGELWLVAGGIGSFPLFFLAQAALQRGLSVRLFWGGLSRSFLESAGLSDWQRLQIPLDLTTQDGSLGRFGLVTEALAEHLRNKTKDGFINSKVTGESVWVATCGPSGMMRAVVECCRDAETPVEVSLEERMGCAVGACLGCVATLKDNDGALVRKKVCQDGPIFRGEEVIWDGIV